jgi:hypothetical protein
MATAKGTPPPDAARDSMLQELVDRGELEECPTCLGLGVCSPKAAARARLALPIPPDDRPTERTIKK